MRIRNKRDRRGITLLFVISMIVLFLLMGTTFLVISNDYFKSSRKRAKSKIYVIDHASFVQRAFYDAVRGPELTNLTSPLRGHDLLSDQYGFGFTGTVDIADTVTGSGDQFVEITLRNNEVTALHNPGNAPTPLPDVAGIYKGLVFSFVSGPASGISTRIVEHYIDTMTMDHKFWIIPTWIDRGVVAVGDLVDSEIIINGREFTGIGAGSFTAGDDIGGEALFPNRIGTTLADFRTEYMGSEVVAGSETGTPSKCFNEPYDAADFQNMFLSGRDSAGDIIPSFHRSSLYEHHYAVTDTPFDIREYSFRPVYLDVAPMDGIPDAGSTANANFAYNQYVDVINNAPPAPEDDLEVDTDNDGELDSVFIDPGYGIITDRDGKQFKPLVAYRIVDMDGRFNLNVHGNLSQVQGYNNYITTSVNMLGGATVLPRGEGYGPPEISLTGLFNAGTYASLLATRYGADGRPGDGGVGGKSLSKLIGYPVDEVDWANGRFGTVNRSNGTTEFQPSLFASSPMNIHGRFAVGTPVDVIVQTGNSYDNFRDRNYSAFSNGMPVIDMLESSTTLNEFDSNPYEMSFAPLPFGDANDTPFTASELERVLRQFDIDSNLLPSRLLNVTGNALSGANSDNRELVTTDSFEVPTLHENLKLKLIDRFVNPPYNLPFAMAVSRADGMVDPTVEDMFAPELLVGLKMDINRALGNGYDDNQDGAVDDPAEADTDQNWDNDSAQMDLENNGMPGIQGGFQQRPRVRLARHLYMLALLVTDPIDVDLDGDGMPDADSYEQVVAQWAVNVVDFRDPDSIMTRFLYDLDPWDGTWDATETVWGCERPEMLISETYASHSRRLEDTPVGGGGDPHFDNRLRPEAFAFVELYNPWTQNSLNQRLDTSLYAGQGVHLTRKSDSPSGSNDDRSPVWRLSFDRPDRGATPDSENTTPLRYVYFVDPTDAGNDTVGDDDLPTVEVFYSDFGSVTVRPGEQAVIGSVGYEDPSNAGEFIVPMGRLSTKTAVDEVPDNLQLDQTTSIILEPANEIIRRFPNDTTVPGGERQAKILPINLPRSFNVSDQFDGYPTVDTAGAPPVAIGDGQWYVSAFDQPLDAATDNNRNADDLRYIWADDEMSESFRVVKLERLANPLLPWDGTTNPYLTIDRIDLDLVAFNGVQAADDTMGVPLTGTVPSNVVENNVSHERGGQDGGRLLWQAGRFDQLAATIPGPGTHYFDMELVDSLGKTNDAYINPSVAGEASFGFPWLNWNNRPYVSHLELANVPSSEPKWLTRNFTTNDGTDPYAGQDDVIRGRYYHLLNFFANDDDSTGGPRANFYRLMDYVEVPSRFLGTEQKMNPSVFLNSPFNVLPRYRVPGKINLNTIYSETVWEGLQGAYAGGAGLMGDGCSWTEFQDSREGGAGLPTDFGNPFRPAGTGNNVPIAALENPGVQSTLFREGAGAGEPLLDFVSGNQPNRAAYNTNRSAYFLNAQRQRLGNLVTTKSSVFAVWITVAYFEVDEQGRVGLEVGSDTGNIKRNRGFYIYDRSLPVAFEPGKNHNVERGILVQSIIE